jgi:hypothetical protein
MGWDGKGWDGMGREGKGISVWRKINSRRDKMLV